MSNKSPAYYASRFWIFVYAAIVFITMTVQLALGLVENNNVPIQLEALNKIVNGTTSLPMEILCWGWTVIITAFCGFDRVVDIRETQHLPSGQVSKGDLAKLRFIIIIAIFFYLYGLVCSCIVDKDFQLGALLSSIISSITMYFTGNKLVKTFKYSHKKDVDNDGIPDSIQEEYEKWAREQRKNGTDQNFITLEYFFDENPSAFEKMKSMDKD